jgi:uncharacterized membrane protein YkvA (DUF1232 family)
MAIRHPETPWYAKALGGAALFYLLSPVDLIPDWIPVLGQLDDIILVPAGLYAAYKLIPRHVWQECRELHVDKATGSFWTR